MNAGFLKVLLIDRDPERRKERISTLKKNGYRVFPALDLQQAKQRCKPGAYDLIVVNAGEQPEMALEFCEWIRSNDPKQAVLLMVGAIVQIPRTGLHGSRHSGTVAGKNRIHVRPRGYRRQSCVTEQRKPTSPTLSESAGIRLASAALTGLCR